MKLSRTVLYAVHATCQLAQARTVAPVPCSQLAAEGNMPERFLLQVLRQLVQGGILHSTRGVDGGYSLERRPEEITLLEMIEAVDGPVCVSLPESDEKSQSPWTIRLREAMEDVTEKDRRQLQSITLADLLDHKRLARA